MTEWKHMAAVLHQLAQVFARELSPPGVPAPWQTTPAQEQAADAWVRAFCRDRNFSPPEDPWVVKLLYARCVAASVVPQAGQFAGRPPVPRRWVEVLEELLVFAWHERLRAEWLRDQTFRPSDN